MTASKRAKNDVKADLRRLADVIQREVDAGADTVEEIHRSIAAMPLDVLEKLDVFEDTVKDVRKAQQAAIGAVYKLVHKVNREVGKLAQDLLDGQARRPRKPAARRSPARAQAHSHA